MPDPSLDDLEAGMMFEFGGYRMTEEEIISFGCKFDPQPFHIGSASPADCADSMLIASGWHTCAVTMRMVSDYFRFRKNGLPAPGVNEIRFVRPVNPGDRLSVRQTVVSVRPSASKPDRGVAMMQIETLNQACEVVLTMSVPFMLRRRSREPAERERPS